MKGILYFALFIFISVSHASKCFADDAHTFSSQITNTQKSNPDSLLESFLSRSWQIRNSDPELALQYGLNAMELAQMLNDYENLVKAHSFTGVAYRLLGDYMQAIDIFFNGLALAKKYNIPQQEGYAYINIANLYIYLEYYNVALENLGQALKIAQKIEHKGMLSYVYLNMGRAQMHSMLFEEARENISKALQLRIETENVAGQAVCYKYLGDIYFNETRYPEALENYQQALHVVDYQSDRHLVGNIYLKIAQINYTRGIYEEVKSYGENALAIGQEVNSRLIIHDALKILSQVDMALGDHQKANHRLQEMILYADTLTNQRLAEKVLNTEFQWERQKRQAEIDLLNKDKEIQRLNLSRQKVLNLALIIFSSLILLGGIILFILFNKIRYKNKILWQQKDELDHLNKAKDKMFMVIGHDLRGPIWTLKALIEIIKEEEEVLFENKNLTENFNALTKSVQGVSDLLENLLFWAKAQDGDIIFNQKTLKLNQIITQSLQSYKPWASLKKIEVKNQVSSEYMVSADENMLKTVIRNLLSNAIKFSHVNGQVSISAIRENGYHKVMIKDQGIGFSADMAKTIFNKEVFVSTKGTGNEMGSGIGLSLCREFIEKHGGTIWAESQPQKGAVFFFTLPVME